jgi:hypothetical protein
MAASAPALNYLNLAGNRLEGPLDNFANALPAPPTQVGGVGGSPFGSR